jgi:hypothetical protein
MSSSPVTFTHVLLILRPLQLLLRRQNQSSRTTTTLSKTWKSPVNAPAALILLDAFHPSHS